MDNCVVVAVAALVCRCSNSKSFDGLLRESVFDHVLNPILRGGTAKPGSAASLTLTTMSEYDFRPGGSLKLKRTTDDGVVKKYVFINPILI